MLVRHKGPLLLAPFLGLAAGLAVACFTRGQTVLSPSLTRPPDAMECGHWAVLRAAELLGVPTTPKAVRDMMPAGKNGHSLKEIVEALGQLGLVARGRKEALDDFLTKDGIRIVHMASPDHFIVVARTSTARAIFFDNWGRHQHLPASVLKKRWSGKVLYVERPRAHSMPNPAAREPRPSVRFETLFLDKGDIPLTAASRKVDYTFPVRNVGAADLIIKKVHTDCRCLAAKPPDTPIPPGGGAVIKLEYSVDGRRRTFVHEALVETNDPSLPVVLLRTAGNVDRLVSVSPPMLDLGAIPAGGARRAHLLIRYSGEAEFDLRELKLGAGLASLALRETADQDVINRLWPRAVGQVKVGKALRVLEVVVTPSAEDLGSLNGEITICTNIPAFERIAVAVRGSVVPPVAIIPSLLTFGPIGADKRLTRSVSLVSLIDQPFRLVCVHPVEPGLAWTADSTTDQGKRVSMSFSATGSAVQRVSGQALILTVECRGLRFDLHLPAYGWPVGQRSTNHE